jgi:5-hydroxyisourate hydrolase
MPQSPSPASRRLSSITSHLSAAAASASPLKQNKMPPPPTRPPITCHILDTLTGLPAQNIPVTLQLLSPSPPSAEATIIFTALTNADGRVPGWTAAGTSEPNATLPDLQTVFESSDEGADMMWVAKFATLRYFEERGIKPFFPEVEIRFLTSGFGGAADGQEKGHWHVPLLLGPFSYTTYRGS